MNNKLLIIGHKRHGKDTLAEIIYNNTGLSYTSSSQEASDLFIYEALKDKYNYSNAIECFEDRVNHRKEWFDLICDYNKDDPARLAKVIMNKSDIYVGMRSNRELQKCIDDKVFNYIIAIYDPRKELESADSFDIDVEKYADVVIYNNGTFDELQNKVLKLIKGI